VIRFHANIDHVATLRNARGTEYPDPVFAAMICEQAGADGITLHLREDRRHIRDADLTRMRSALSTRMNLEMAATDEMSGIAERVKPDVVTLVPERREERTTEGGLDASASRAQIEKIAAMCARAKIKLSLFIEADRKQIELSRELGAAQIELHTGSYCDARGSAREAELERLRTGAFMAAELGLEVAAGHGLSRSNVIDIAALEPVAELNIGHALVADAVFVGMDRAVRDFREAIARGLALRPHPP
jgi:pyridoxine 5-phosphate synthase